MVKKKSNNKRDSQKADARVLGQILAAQNVVFALPDTTRIAEFYAQTLISVPGITCCYVCLGGISAQPGKMERSICAECESLQKTAGENGAIAPASSDFNCILADQPDMRIIAVDSYQHHFGFFVFKIENTNVFDLYQPFISNLANHVALCLENRLQRDLLEKAHNELEQRIEERTKELHQLNLQLEEELTERKQAEEAVKKSEEEYRHFFEDDLTGDYISAPDGRILSCNPAFARIFGFESVAEALKSNVNALYPEPEEREIFLLLLKERKRLEYYESEFIRCDGSRAYCIENAVGMFDSNGTLVQIRGYLFDESRRKLVEQQLVQAQKLESLGTLASGIAHDFNNILGIILGYASLLTRGSSDPENVKHSAEAVVKASNRGAALVKQLLTFARKVDVQVQSVGLNDIVNEISRLLSETFSKTIDIVLDLEKDLPTITGDATQLHQVLLNLCVNARDAMPNGGTISITTCCQEGETIRAKFPRAIAHKYVVLRIWDTGIGMDKRTQSRIFEPFFTTKGVGKGTGLGLSVVFGILESHNSFVDVESEPGKGTTFSLYFPVEERTIESYEPSADQLADIPGGAETILLIEDEEMIAEMVKAILVVKGYTTLTACDGEEGLEMFKRHQQQIAVVLSDLGLPKYGGDEVFKRIRAIDPKAKVILASGFIEANFKSEMLKGGVIQFIQKPYSPSDVLRAIRTAIDGVELGKM